MTAEETLITRRPMDVLKNIQLQRSKRAIARYKNAPLHTSADEDRKSGNKRHIVAIDDSLKINYEVIRHIPGQLAQGDEIEDLNRLKLIHYKDSLNKMHEEYIDVWKKDDTDLADTDYTLQDEPTLIEEKEWLSELNGILSKDYKEAVQLEKKWFLLKEIMLEACTRLDLCAESNPLLDKNQITLDESKGTLL
ncbi:unnamed protein product [Kluyveromyces dobzhanskii CBS 2104]|uniref:WGS project CCBQ000000000 data, contig 00058 n=1 Tax=Kluyveromyces dobzhanskii CBS 2104 TaxID=1427455 RepID=A0A0A8LBM7_9SACH|nr:unnamed protein product [Kluyveromyces dobzhanskii CBS 2104]